MFSFVMYNTVDYFSTLLSVLVDYIRYSTDIVDYRKNVQYTRMIDYTTVMYDKQ